VIGNLLKLLDDLQEELLNETGCPQDNEPECTTLTLGVLMRARSKITNSDVPLKHPYDGYSITAVLCMIRGIAEPMPLHPGRAKNRISRWGQRDSPCSIGGRLQTKIESVESDIWLFCRSFS
jgi:hypothetical protein